MIIAKIMPRKVRKGKKKGRQRKKKDKKEKKMKKKMKKANVFKVLFLIMSTVPKHLDCVLSIS